MATAQKGTRWGDDDEDDLLQHHDKSERESKGMRTVVHDGIRNAGSTPAVVKVPKRVLERKTWVKFGATALRDTNVTHVSTTEVTLESPNDDRGLIDDPAEKIYASIGSRIVVCRHCGMVGDHWTLKCPYMDTPVDATSEDEGKPAGDITAPSTSPADRYVPPSVRGRAGAARVDDSQDDRDSATLRVTNISPDTREDDLNDLFRAFGPVARVYLVKDRETFVSCGFAFVNFMYREDAERAMNKLQGYGYDHLILKIEWAKPSNKPAGEWQGSGPMSTTFRSGYGKALPQNVAPPPRK